MEGNNDYYVFCSPIFASEFGDEIVARLSSFDGSIPGLFLDSPIGIFLFGLIRIFSECISCILFSSSCSPGYCF